MLDERRTAKIKGSTIKNMLDVGGEIVVLCILFHRGQLMTTKPPFLPQLEIGYLSTSRVPIAIPIPNFTVEGIEFAIQPSPAQPRYLMKITFHSFLSLIPPPPSEQTQKSPPIPPKHEEHPCNSFLVLPTKPK